MCKNIINAIKSYSEQKIINMTGWVNLPEFQTFRRNLGKSGHILIRMSCMTKLMSESDSMHKNTPG